MTKEITIDIIVKNIELLIKDCEKLPLSMEAHVLRNQQVSKFVNELVQKYELVPKKEVTDAKDKDE